MIIPFLPKLTHFHIFEEPIPTHRPMDDGEMGSLYLFPQGKINESRKLGRQISEFQFTDIDGVEVIASLNVDVDGVLFELDIWKTNFEKLVKLPDL